MDKEVQQLRNYTLYSSEEQQTFPLISYYLKLFVIKRATAIAQKYEASGQNVQNLRGQVQTWQSELDALAYQLGGQLSNANQTKNRQDMINYILKIFAKNDYDDCHDNYTKETQLEMAKVSRYFEMMTMFGPLETENNQKRLYAKSKAVEIMKKLNNPELYPRNNQGSAEQKQGDNGQSANNFPNFVEQQKQQLPNYGVNQQNFGGQQQNFGQNGGRIASVFNNVPTIISANNPQPQQKNTNDISKPQPPAAGAQVNKFNMPPPETIPQFNNPYTNHGIGFNIPQHEVEEQVVTLCRKAISELDFNQFANAKEALKLALQALQNVKQ